MLNLHNKRNETSRETHYSSSNKLILHPLLLDSPGELIPEINHSLLPLSHWLVVTNLLSKTHRWPNKNRTFYDKWYHIFAAITDIIIQFLLVFSSGIVIGGPTGHSPRAALVKGRHIERMLKKICCVREIK